MSCFVGKALDTLSTEDRIDMEAVLGNHVSSVLITKWFERRGHPQCTVTVVNKHREARCDCYEEEE